MNIEEELPKCPDTKMWNTDVPTIDFVNKDDFHLSEMMEKLGLDNLSPSVRDSLGCTDREEILRRQNAIRFLLENPKAREFFVTKSTPSGFDGNNSSIVEYFSKGENWADTAMQNYLKECITLVSPLVEKSDYMKGSPIANAVDFFQEQLPKIVESEKKISETLMPELIERFDYQGNLKVETYWLREDGEGPRQAKRSGFTIKEKEVFGQRRYAFFMDKAFFQLPTWGWKNVKEIEKPLVRMLGGILYFFALPLLWLFESYNSLAEGWKFSPLVTKDLPTEIANDVLEAVEEMIPEEYYTGTDFKFELYFRYDSKGLFVQVVDYDLGVKELSYGGDRRIINFSRSLYGEGKTWYSDLKTYFFNLKKEKLNKRSNGRLYNLGLYGNLDRFFFESEKGKSLLEGTTVASKWSDQDLRFAQAMSVIRGKKDLSVSYNRIIEVSKFIKNLKSEIAFVSGIAASVKNMLDKFPRKDWCFPEILSDDQHLISFDKMLPMHLIGHHRIEGGEVKLKDLVAISKLAPINGQMMCITGQNAGGKTATKVELAYQIFLAQSGFPVFSKSFALNPKKVIGLVFVERGEGSLVQLLLMKTKNILKALEKYNGNEAVIIIDELLTGTQEASAIGIGERTLRKLNSVGCSVIFSTQITALAEYAQRDLNALTFGFNDKHQAFPGIATGNPDLLIEKLGMTELLDIGVN